MGAKVARTEVGDASPVKAIENELEQHQEKYDGIIISTLPLQRSRWVALDQPRRIERRFKVPVRHVVGHSVTMTREDLINGLNEDLNLEIEALLRGVYHAAAGRGMLGHELRELLSFAPPVGWEAVHHVILTHYHPDHIGGVGEVLAAAPKATAYAGAADIPQIKSPRPIKAVDEVFGLRVIATPGHTPGHVCVFDPAGSLLILGDAMNNIGNKLDGPDPQYTADMAQAHQSVKKLAKLTFQRALFGHGDPIDKGASQAIAKLAGTL